MSAARDLARELSNLAEDSREPDRLLMAQRVLALTYLGLGEYGKSLDACDRGIELYDPDRQTTYLRLYGEDPGLFCYVYCVWTNYWLGYPDVASARAGQALKLAKRLPSRYALSYVLVLIADFFLWQRRLDEALECAYAAHEVAEEQSIVQWQAWAEIVIGNALTAKGQLQEGLSRILKGREAIRMIRGRFGLILLAPTIADAYRDHGKYAEGLGVLEEAESTLRETSMLQRVSEIYRLRGNLLGASGAAVDQSEAAYREALDFARTQEAKTLELRAATDLARLWQTQGRNPEAHDLLAPLYDWFTEGFDTPDLRDAKALLDELN
jgi:tetratricopeptide (TPR) repeat protein